MPSDGLMISVASENEVLRRCALGAFLRHWRATQGLSVERAGLSHMTWRRLEDGHAVRAQTHSVVETATELPAGLVARALRNDEALIELAELLGIAGPDENQSPAAFVRSFGGRSVWAQQLAESPAADLPAVGALVAKLSARKERSQTEDAALRSLVAWLVELADVSRNGLVRPHKEVRK